MRARPTRLTAFLLGILLTLAGRAAIVDPGAATRFVEGALGTSGHAATGFLLALLPHEIGLGLGPFLLGSLIAALALGLPPLLERQAPADGAHSAAHPARFGIPALVALACLLGVVTSALLARQRPGAAAVVSWLAAPLPALLAAVVLDRRRGTHFGNPFPARWEWTSVALLMGLDLLWVAHDLGDWRWSGTPDESVFFVFARGLADGRYHRFPLSESGVFGYHPVLSSYYQAGFMKLFGMNAFGWRLSSAVALAAALPPTYLLTRELYGRRAAYIAALLLGSAQLAVGYAHFGYNNAQVYPVVTWALAILAWSIPRRSAAGCFAAGYIMGIGFFTFYSARLSVPLAPLLAWSVGGLALFRREWKALFTVMAGVALAALPLLIHPAFLVGSMLRQSGATTANTITLSELPEALSTLTASAAQARIAAHWLLSVFYWVWSESGHFQICPVVDPVSAAFAAVGLWLGLGALLSGRRDFLFPAYLFSAFAAGAISPYPWPPLTRLMFLAPFTAMLAAVSLDQCARLAAGSTRQKGLGAGVVAGLVTTSVVWNVVALHVNVSTRYHGYGDGTTGELVRITRELPETCRVVYVQSDRSLMANVDGVLAQYGMDDRFTYLRPYSVVATAYLATIVPPFFVSYDLRDPAERHAVEQQLTNRFPEASWRDSDPGRPWNLRYFYVPSS